MLIALEGGEKRAGNLKKNMGVQGIVLEESTAKLGDSDDSAVIIKTESRQRRENVAGTPYALCNVNLFFADVFLSRGKLCVRRAGRFRGQKEWRTI